MGHNTGTKLRGTVDMHKCLAFERKVHFTSFLEKKSDGERYKLEPVQ